MEAVRIVPPAARRSPQSARSLTGQRPLTVIPVARLPPVVNRLPAKTLHGARDLTGENPNEDLIPVKNIEPSKMFEDLKVNIIFV